MRTKVCGIYRITSPSGRFYIGSSAHCRKRMNEHMAALRRGDHANRKLQNAANKHGADSLVFAVIFECSRDRLREAEQLAINCYRPEYNIEQTVAKVLHDFWSDLEWRKKNAERCRRQSIERWQDPEYRERVGSKCVQAMLTPEVKERARLARANRLATDPAFREAQRAKFIQQMMVANQAPGVRARLVFRQRASLTALSKDAEFCRRRNEAITEANRKPVLCVETGRVFASIKDANAHFGGKQQSNIGAMCQGRERPKSVYGHTWRFVEKEAANG